MAGIAALALGMGGFSGPAYHIVNPDMDPFDDFHRYYPPTRSIGQRKRRKTAKQLKAKRIRKMAHKARMITRRRS